MRGAIKVKILSLRVATNLKKMPIDAASDSNALRYEYSALYSTFDFYTGTSKHRVSLNDSVSDATPCRKVSGGIIT